MEIDTGGGTDTARQAAYLGLNKNRDLAGVTDQATRALIERKYELKLDQIYAGSQEAFAIERRGSSAGTFSAREATGMGSTSVAERTANAVERVAASTGELNRAAQRGRLVFAGP